ncbi:MAG: hypothetical protein WCP45_17660, partial [Verrucomicrobiota bacterium]
MRLQSKPLRCAGGSAGIFVLKSADNIEWVGTSYALRKIMRRAVCPQKKAARMHPGGPAIDR